VEASSTPMICRPPDSRRHQLSAIARRREQKVLSVDLHPIAIKPPADGFRAKQEGFLPEEYPLPSA